MSENVFVVLDGKFEVELTSFDQIWEFVMARNTPWSDLGRVFHEAQTADEKRSAIRRFETWARLSSLLIGKRSRAELAHCARPSLT